MTSATRGPRGARRRTAAAAVTVLALAACGTGANAGDDEDGSSTAGVPGLAPHEYLPGLEAHPHVPESAGSAPVVVMIPGGSWQSANPSALAPLAEALAAGGVVAVPVTIRASADDVVYPTPVEDILCALADGAATAREAGIDPDRLVLLGHSSGAHLSAVATLAVDRFSPDCEDPVLEPDAFIGLAGPYDIRQFADAADALFAAPIDEAPGEWDAANPVIHADLRPEVPVLLLHGDADDVVPVSFTTDFGTALEAAGHATTVRVLTGEDHETVYAAETAARPVVDWLESLP